MRLEGKVCVVTGGGSGIGEASAKLFAKEGARVVIVDVDATNGRRVVNELKSHGHDSIFAQSDVSNEVDAKSTISQVTEQYGKLDVLFNNAGVSAVGDVTQCAIDDWDRVMRVNVRGVFLMSKYAVDFMRLQGYGTIINMSSTIAVMGLQSRAVYAASKGAVLALTRAMAADHSSENIRVCALLPGTVYTPFVEGYLRRSYADNMDEAVSNLKRRQLNNELMTPQDVASAALYLASDEARFALGTALVIDGGVSTAKVF